jgi:hypothetical protein
MARGRCPQRSVGVPQQLNLLEDPSPDSQVWQQLTPEQRSTAIDTMARIIRKAVVPPTGVVPSEASEETNE